MSDERLLTEVIDEVFRLADAFAAAGDALVASEGLTAARWLTLGAVAHEPRSVAGIARRRGMRRQSAAESVAALERAGLVDRSPDPSDARAPIVSITAEGKTMLDRIRPVRVAWATRTARAADAADLATFLRVARQLREALRSGEVPPP
jgi:DNA-binding MarR family transcriptional regulator